MESGEDLPEDAYPAPTFCRQCGHNPPAAGYVICGECDAKNKRYDAKVAGLRIEFAETRGPTTRQSNYMTRGVKQGRDRKLTELDEEVHHTEQNTRTEYHGDNYNDE